MKLEKHTPKGIEEVKDLEEIRYLANEGVVLAKKKMFLDRLKLTSTQSQKIDAIIDFIKEEF